MCPTTAAAAAASRLAASCTTATRALHAALASLTALGQVFHEADWRWDDGDDYDDAVGGSLRRLVVALFVFVLTVLFLSSPAVEAKAKAPDASVGSAAAAAAAAAEEAKGGGGDGGGMGEVRVFLRAAESRRVPKAGPRDIRGAAAGSRRLCSCAALSDERKKHERTPLILYVVCIKELK